MFSDTTQGIASNDLTWSDSKQSTIKCPYSD